MSNVVDNKMNQLFSIGETLSVCGIALDVPTAVNVTRHFNRMAGHFGRWTVWLDFMVPNTSARNI